MIKQKKKQQINSDLMKSFSENKIIVLICCKFEERRILINKNNVETKKYLGGRNFEKN